MKGWFCVALAVSGCGVIPGTACTEIGCVDGLTVALLPQEPLADGTWALTVSGRSGGNERCTFTVEDGAVTEQDCELSQDDQGIRLHALPVEGEVDLLLEHDGQEVHEETLSPSWQESRPNGPGCPPVCRTAEVEILL